MTLHARRKESAHRCSGDEARQGISNGLDGKLQAALEALDDINVNSNVAAINTLHAFINAVEAQRGDKIINADALMPKRG